LVLRLVVGLTFVVHAAQKVFRVFVGQGMRARPTTVDQIGLRPSKLNAWPASLAELAGGLLIALGLLMPFAAAALIATMTAAVLTVNLRNGFLTTNNG